MKFLRAEFDRVINAYVSIVENGILIKRDVKGEFPFTTLLTAEEKQHIIPQILLGTKGWFSKPLTSEWLSNKLEVNIPADSVEEGFFGSTEWRLSKIEIKKLAFVLHFTVVKKVEDPKINLDFELPAPPSSAPTDTPTRRKEQKEYVMKVRERAARLLFKAESLTQQYCDIYGDDTDWEDEASDSESI
jgi:hypothetical protein